ncbi:TPA: DUF551 domain-containing protein [Citrobacter freundii]
MTTITREQLIGRAQARLELMQAAAREFHESPSVQMDLELARIALATLEAEPVAWIVHARTGDQLTTDGNYVANAEGILGLHSTPLYTAPPAPVANSYPLLEFVKEYIDSWGLGMAGDSGLLASAKQAIADSAIQQPVPVVPATLPCSVELKPGLIIGKGCKTETLLTALQRRADYYAEIDAMTPEERAEHDANIEAFKAMLPQPDIEMLSSALRNAPLAPSDSQGRPRSPVVPEAKCDDDGSVTSDFDHGWNACRSAMLQDGNSPVTPDCWIPVSERMPERDVDVQVYCADKKEQMVGYMERNETEGWFRFASLPNGGGVYCKPTHWMSLPAAPQQAKSQHKKK